MELDMELFNQFKPDEVIRVVTTKAQNVHKPMEVELTFVAIKSYGNDWAIYGHYSSYPPERIREIGDKVTSKDMIKSLCPCTAEVMARYRF